MTIRSVLCICIDYVNILMRAVLHLDLQPSLMAKLSIWPLSLETINGYI